MSTYSDIVRTAVYGRDVREAIADGLDDIDGKVTNVVNEYGDVPSRISTLEDEMSGFKMQNTEVSVPISWKSATSYWNVENATAVLTSISSKFYANEPIDVSPGDFFYIRNDIGATSKARIWALTNNNYEIISMADDTNGEGTVEDFFFVPSGATKLLITTAIARSNVVLHKFTSHKYRGSFESLGYTTLSKALDGGWYGCSGTYIHNITDLPSDYPSGQAFTLEVFNPSFAQSSNAVYQLLWAYNGHCWNRLLESDGALWRNWRSYDSIVDDLEQDVNYLKNIFLTEKEITNFTMTKEYYWNIEGDTAVYTRYSGSNYFGSSSISIQEGDILKVSAIQGGTHKARIWTVCDDNFNILAMANDYYGSETHTESFVAPEGATRLVITSHLSFGSPYARVYLTRASVPSSDNELLKDKTIAILGDSISTNGNTGVDANVPEITISELDVGVSLSAYVTYYDVQAGLTLGGHTFTSNEIGTEVTFIPNANDVGKSIGLPANYNANSVTTWWEHLQNALGNNTIPVCWSGSSVTSHEASSNQYKTSYAWHDAQIRKCGVRVKGSMTRNAPDIIIIYRGVNDMSHSPYTKLTSGYFNSSNWDYPTSDTVGSDYGYKEGLCLTIKKLRAAYPESFIVLCTLNVFKRVNYSHFPTNNGYNTLPQYNDAIREVANFMGCGLIEFDKDGITFENCYSGGYITDSSTTPTHPSDKGHRVMGNRAITDLKYAYNSSAGTFLKSDVAATSEVRDFLGF